MRNADVRACARTPALIQQSGDVHAPCGVLATLSVGSYFFSRGGAVWRCSLCHHWKHSGEGGFLLVLLADFSHVCGELVEQVVDDLGGEDL